MKRSHRKRPFQAVKARAQRGARVDQFPQEFRYGWIGPQAAIRHLSLGSLSALYRLINEHGLPYGRAGRLYKFRRVELDAWMTKHRADAAAVRSA